MAILIALTPGFVFSGCQPSSTSSPPAAESEAAEGVTSYFFAEADRCTVLVDFHQQPALKSDTTQLAARLTQEYRRQGKTQCPNAKEVVLSAVIIDKTDQYGRPDFASRTELFTLSGAPDDFQPIRRP